MAIPALSAESSTFQCSTLFQKIFKVHTIAGPKEAMRWGSAKLDSLPSSNLKVIVWNVHKGLSEKWSQDFSQISKESDLILIQEAMKEPKMESTFAALPDREWWFSPGFAKREVLTGLVTSSKAKAKEVKLLHSIGAEPIVKTPKSSMLSKFSLGKGKPDLLVVNIHALNFVTNKNFSLQLEQLKTQIKFHRGPVLLAGDFNVWSPKRKKILDSIVNSLDLEKAKIEESSKLLELDRVYTRGIKVESAKALRHIKSSDHFPLELQLSYSP